MPKRIAVASTADLPPDACLSVEAEGMGIALCNLNGTIYALDNTCPHAGGPLGEGHLEGDCIVCPWHGWRYQVHTGARPENPDFKVDRFPVTIDGDSIVVELP